MYRVMVGKCDGKRSLRRPRSKWKEKIFKKMFKKGDGCAQGYGGKM